jgi:mono/diheme cytochrome c family protein
MISSVRNLPASDDNSMHTAFARKTGRSLIASGLIAAMLLALPLSAQETPPVSPLANSKAAAKAGKATYLRLCQYCHGADGKALENIDFEATNLTDPSRYKYGTEAAQIFNSIKNGAGDDMLPFKDKASDEQIWQLVAFILSIGPDERRPQQE